MIKLMVCGSRTIDDEQFVFTEIEKYVSTLHDDVIIIEGEARGVDSLAKKWALMHNKQIMSFPAQWSIYGKSAGFKRNCDMVNACDQCLILWDGKSAGTKHDIELCKKARIHYKVVINNNDSKEL